MRAEGDEATRLRYGRPFDTGQYRVTGAPVTLTYRVAVAGVFVLIAKSGSYSFTGSTTSLAFTRYVTSGVYVLTGF